jgi:hypothetical protein
MSGTYKVSHGYTSSDWIDELKLWKKVLVKEIQGGESTKA